MAISEYTKAIGMNPDYYTDAYWSRGRAYIEIGQFLLALTDFTKAIQIDPNEAGGYMSAPERALDTECTLAWEGK